MRIRQKPGAALSLLCASCARVPSPSPPHPHAETIPTVLSAQLDAPRDAPLARRGCLLPAAVHCALPAAICSATHAVYAHPPPFKPRFKPKFKPRSCCALELCMRLAPDALLGQLLTFLRVVRVSTQAGHLIRAALYQHTAPSPKPRRRHCRKTYLRVGPAPCSPVWLMSATHATRARACRQNISYELLRAGASTSGVPSIKSRLTCPDCKRLVAERNL
eukprot:364846-Chlamydomonas_euryale.AAC.4